MDHIITVVVATFLTFMAVYVALTRVQTRRLKRGKPLTYRISNIPISISREEFEAALTCSKDKLCHSDPFCPQPALLGWSYARSGHSSQFCVATATFSASPAADEVEAAMKRELNLETTYLRVDLDFFGLTPLVDPINAIVESVLPYVLFVWLFLVY